jgi:hypothetical protein
MGFFTKKSFMFPIRRGNMDCFKYESFFVKNPKISSTVIQNKKKVDYLPYTG